MPDINYWNNYAQTNLVGKKITEVRYMTEKETKNMGWYEKALIIVFDDNSFIVPMADDEGNSAGAIFGQTNKGKDLLFPVI